MSTSVSHGLMASATVMLASLFSYADAADLPGHVHVQTLEPLQEEWDIGGAQPPQRTEFGSAVAIRNGLAFVGMPFALTTGRVAVFSQTTSGWVRTGTLTASDKTSGDEFGRAVSFRDNLAIVGSKRAAYVYKRVNGAWQQIQKIAPPASDGSGGYALALKHEAGVLAVGGLTPADARGVLYIYQQDASGKFVQRARLRPSDSTRFDSFGSAISMTNAIIVVGAPGADGETTVLGSAYIFGRNSSGQWRQRQKLIAVENEPGDGFGYAVAVDRGMILVGAPFAAPEGEPIGLPTPDDHIARGMLYGFMPGASQYVETFRFRPRPDELARYDRYGIAVAMFDQRVAVAASRVDIPMQPADAFLLTYSRATSGLIPLGIAGGAGVLLTADISIANNLLLVGSPFDSFCFDNQCIGKAHLFNLRFFAQ
jgi:FG-GAP repeat